ncbi:hypothetical protein S140_171 [Shewanella sp. phage 1/40]|uniref:hypothetical protein n=1 Tax=Shewanella phage 1/4 TaxID=1458859 RepID=UPI0004F6A1F5|nr:hypothetical protein S14_168 [Shewanella sp. phage 1/4]YP_009104169.1 hypothetical protein S140_171 [Shewanella sp. phage 1/40]AHK11277.1 hypothetical protein S14_168 [Shewanella sp. phage 1/4]AHK11578.1 hypothetical protein S140_171 [Shewanella sp. phage 1/40]
MIPYVLNHTEVGKSRVIDALSEKENFNKLLAVFLEEINILETEMFKLAGSKSIAGSSGIWLDYLGQIISEKRENRSDADYRAALLLRVSVNTANGTIKSLIEVVRAFTEATSVHYTPYYPAHYVVSTDGNKQLTGALEELVEDVSPAGVGYTVISNEDGNKFVPAWITTKPNEVVEHTFLLDNLDELLLDDGEPLLVTAVPDLSYANNTKDHAFLDWGVTETTQSVGYLAQVILPETTQ